MTDDLLDFLRRRDAGLPLAQSMPRRIRAPRLALLPSPSEVRKLRAACRDAAARARNSGCRHPGTRVQIAADPQRQTPAYSEIGWLVYHNDTGIEAGREVMLFLLASGDLAFFEGASSKQWSLAQPPSSATALPYHLSDHERRLQGTDILLLPIPRVLIALVVSVFMQPGQAAPVPQRIIGRAPVPEPTS